NKEVLWSSMIKDTMKRKKPSFNEAYHGYRTFSELLEDAAKENLVELDTDKRSRTYVVTRFGTELNSPAPATAEAKKKSSRRRRSASKRRGQAPAGKAPPSADEAVPAETAALPPADAVPEGRQKQVTGASTPPAGGGEARGAEPIGERPAPRRGERGHRAEREREREAPVEQAPPAEETPGPITFEPYTPEEG